VSPSRFAVVSCPRISHNVKFASGCIERFSAGDLRASFMSGEDAEEFSKARFVEIAESGLAVDVDPLRMLLAESFANHSLQFGVGLDFRSHEIAR
jgi:hypothetical protein